ncbi:MAG TPA: metallophosphoesterase [Chloroflexi bacterium]|nr:metallophosphoesterase [Chloroflexota bacterium]
MAQRFSRRRFLRLALFGLGTAAAACGGGPAYGLLVEPGWLALRRVQVTLPGLPPHLDGFRLALLSDLHRGPLVAQEHIARAVDLVQRTQADLVLLAGDYVTESATFALSCAEELGRLHGAAGVYGCLGNHDHWTDPEMVAGALAGVGIRVLRNEGLEVAQGLWLAAVDDVWEEQADLDAALTGAPPVATIVLLAHEPDFADVVAADGRVALQLSGHSHGGQVCLPLLGPPVLPYLARSYPAGLYRLDQMQLYVTRGVGLIAPPVRFNCRPEVTLLTLRCET